MTPTTANKTMNPTPTIGAVGAEVYSKPPKSN